MAMIRVIDMEGTGLGPDAEVCEIGWCDIDLEGFRVMEPRGTLCRVAAMPPDVRAIHHIKATDTADFPPYDRRILFEEACRAGVVALAAHNADYESRFILGHLPLLCTYKAALRHWPDAPGHSVFALLYWLEDKGEINFDPALAHPPHRAMPDAYATAILLTKMLADGIGYIDLRQWTCEPRLLPTCPIGKYRGKPWVEVDTGFLEWISSKSDMDADIQWNAQREIDRRYQ